MSNPFILFVPVPFEPENLAHTDITTDKIALKWDTPQPETGPIATYHIRWSEDGTTRPETATSETTTYVIENLLPFTKYHVEVAAVNKIGAGPSATLTAKTNLAGNKTIFVFCKKL